MLPKSWRNDQAEIKLEIDNSCSLRFGLFAAEKQL